MLRGGFVFLLLLLSPAGAKAQVAIGQLTGSITYQQQPQTLTGWVAYLDIAGGQLQPTVTPPLPSTACQNGAGGDVQLQTTAAFATAQATLVAINANLGPPAPPYPPGACGTPYGLLVDNGNVVNPGETNGPTLVFTSNTSATISLTSPPVTAAYAVAGWNGGGPGGGGTLLVVPPPPGGGQPTPGTNTQPVPTTIAPRVGVGITADGKTLILAMIDGCEATPLGIENPDFGNVMIGLGANAAVNLDGGGSSTFIFTPPPVPLTPSPHLLGLLNGAGAPPGSPNGLSFSVTSQPLTQPVQSVPPCNASSWRAIYANLGFTLP